MTQEALKLALEALEDALNKPMWDRPKMTKAITAIEEALREHAMREVQRLGQEIEQEPVATVESVATVVSESGNQEVTMSWWHEPALPVGTKLYTTPPQEQQSCDKRTWVGLTEEEFQWIYDNGRTPAGMMEIVEAKLKELNT